MAFTLNADPTFEADVSIAIPGKAKKGVFTMTFKHMSRRELAKFFERSKADAESIEGEQDPNVVLDKQVEELAELIVGWKGVDAEYSRESLERLLDTYPGAFGAILSAFNTGLLEGKVKN